jgi:hypothetical protein
MLFFMQCQTMSLTDWADAVDQGDNNEQRLKPETSPEIPNLTQEISVDVQSLQQPRCRYVLALFTISITNLDFNSEAAHQMKSILQSCMTIERKFTRYTNDAVHAIKQSIPSIYCRKMPHVHSGCLSRHSVASLLHFGIA